MDLKKIYFPSVGVDIVFNIDGDTPVSRSSIIYDVDYAKKTMVLAQPTIAITPKTDFQQLHLTTIVQTKSRKARVGVPCRPIKFIDNYPLANKSSVKALLIEYQLPAKETNIRTAFRIHLSRRHTVKAKLIYRDLTLLSTKDFKIKDISFGGMGLVVKKAQGNSGSLLAGVKRGTLLPMGISLVDKEQIKPVATFGLKIRVVRVNPNYSETHILLGLKIEKIKPDDEVLLNRFIHDAQIAELKRLSKKG